MSNKNQLQLQARIQMDLEDPKPPDITNAICEVTGVSGVSTPSESGWVTIDINTQGRKISTIIDGVKGVTGVIANTVREK